MFLSLFSAFESGVIFAIMALGVYLSFRVLDFPDLTVDGSFVTGASIAAVMITADIHPLLATFLALVGGFAAGCITGLLHTKGKINALLSGILMMTALWSINLRIMSGKANIALLGDTTLIQQISGLWKKTGLDEPLNGLLEMIGLGNHLPETWGIFIVMILVVLLIKFVTDWFLQTEIGLAVRATGDNSKMIRSFSGNTDRLTILGIGLSNGYVALAGALYAQYAGFSSVSMGIGMIITGLASVIIGEALVGTKNIARTTLAVICGAIIYRIVTMLALRVEFLKSGDLKLITAAIVVLALVIPRILEARREKRRRQKKRREMQKSLSQ